MAPFMSKVAGQTMHLEMIALSLLLAAAKDCVDTRNTSHARSDVDMFFKLFPYGMRNFQTPWVRALRSGYEPGGD